MDLNIFFDSVEEELVDKNQSPHCVSKSLTINTYNIADIDGFDLALIGLTEGRGSAQSGDIEKASYFIRQKLYNLKKGSGSYRILDLGDLRNGMNLEDTHQRLEEVCHYLISKKIVPIIFGGTQDFAMAQYRSYEAFEKLISLVNVDGFIDMDDSDSLPLNERYLYDVFTKEPNYLFNYIHLAYQTYLNDQPTLETLESLYFDGMRLGQVKNDIKEMEPMVREADLMVWDISAIQKSFCPGSYKPQSFGLTGEEACQLAWYAGLNSKLSSHGIYEYFPEYDDDSFSTASVIATMIWYFIEGYYNRKAEKGFGSTDYLRYEVSLDGNPSSIIFYKSKMTEKWWMEVPFPKDYHKFAKNAIVPCSYTEYEVSTKGEIPERWIEMQTKFS